MYDDLTVVDLLHRASQCAEDLFQRQTGGINLTARQYAILRSVSRREGLSQTAIVAATGIDRSTVAEMTRRLTRKGLLQRRRSQGDARTYAVRLTAAGRKMIEAVALAARTSDDMVHAAVRSLRRAEFRGALIELIEAQEAERRQGETQIKRRRRGSGSTSRSTT
jgi:DNA-binding MarR family transcriptional regulator